MIEVSIRLWTQQERALFNQFIDEIEKLRNAVPAEIVPDDESRTPLGRVLEQSLKEVVTLYANVTPAPPATFEPTPVAMEEAVKAYGRAKGFPAARTLLDEYTKGKIGDVPAEKRAELYAKLTGGMTAGARGTVGEHVR